MLIFKLQVGKVFFKKNIGGQSEISPIINELYNLF